MSANTPTFEIVSRAAGNLNEDSWLLMQAGPLEERFVMAAIDGATTRLTPPPLQRALDTLPVPLTPAAYAARMTRDALARHSAEGFFTEPRALLIEANADLGRALHQILGALTLDAMEFPHEIHRTLAHDTRLVRLGLPACAATLADYDPGTRLLRYAHAGDTLLLVRYQDGQVEILTQPDDAPSFRPMLKRMALKMRGSHPDLPMRELLRLPEVQSMDLHAALYHNYVDDHGLPQPGQGIGVVDGLPELRYFVQSDEVQLDDVELICLLTDGLEWPPDAREIFTEDPDEAIHLMHVRRRFMAGQIADRGLAGYLDLLWMAQEKDADHERYPRIKTHDDATGVVLRFG